jgi:hypothetical protein
MIEESRGRGKIDLCAFCREPACKTAADEIDCVKKMAEVGNPYALLILQDTIHGEILWECHKTLLRLISYISRQVSLDMPRHIIT